MATKSYTLDIIALTSSLICAIHCAAIPIVLSISSLGGLHFIENAIIEWSFITLGVLFFFLSLWPSYKKYHHNAKPISIAVFGFLFIAIGRIPYTETWEIRKETNAKVFG